MSAAASSGRRARRALRAAIRKDADRIVEAHLDIAPDGSLTRIEAPVARAALRRLLDRLAEAAPRPVTMRLTADEARHLSRRGTPPADAVHAIAAGFDVAGCFTTSSCYGRVADAATDEVDDGMSFAVAEAGALSALAEPLASPGFQARGWA
jgi:hypothetical protein